METPIICGFPSSMVRFSHFHGLFSQKLCGLKNVLNKWYLGKNNKKRDLWVRSGFYTQERSLSVTKSSKKIIFFHEFGWKFVTKILGFF